MVGEGSVVEFKNSDRVPHDLSLPDLPSLMPLERLAPGALRRQKFLTAGGYAVRDSEHPHLVISVLVVAAPYFATVDDKGGFRIADAPDGKATLKVWSGGAWVHQQEIEVGPKSDGPADQGRTRTPGRRPGELNGEDGAMFLSKIWFVLVGLAAGVATTAAFVAPRSRRPAHRRAGGAAAGPRPVRGRADAEGGRPQLDRLRGQAQPGREPGRVAGRGQQGHRASRGCCTRPCRAG